MDVIQSIAKASQQLKDLFKDKAELRGLDDWDTFLGCIMLLDNAVTQLQMEGTGNTEEG